MAANGYAGPMPGHIGRIPNFGKSNLNSMGSVEPPACIQNAMMTKDKKPFTYTPGGLDLSQIRTPSMARRMARQRSYEDHDQANHAGYHPQGGPQGGVPPPPPPPPKVPAPPPPPPIVIQAPNSNAPKPLAPGERPKIDIPENPIGMLRKTHSPYHWEAEKAELQRMGPVPKYVEKVPSPLTVKMPPSSFSQQQPQSYTPKGQNNFQRTNSQKHPDSPIYRPEAQYAHQKSSSPNINGSPPTREILQRQDSQFNKSPQPFNNQSPLSNNSPYSPAPNNNWRQPERRDSPASANSNTQQSPQFNRGPFSPNTQQYSPNFQNQSPPTNSGPVFHTLPRAGQRNQDAVNNVNYNNVRDVKQQSPQVEPQSAPWRTNTLNRYPREAEQKQPAYNNQNANVQQQYNAPWKSNETNNNDKPYVPPWAQEGKNQQQQYTPPWVNNQDNNNNRVQETTAPWKSHEVERSPPSKNETPRYQSTISIPVTPRKQNTQPDYSTPPQKEAVYVNQEPVFYCPDSPKSIPPWVKSQKEKTKTPPPAWCQRPLENVKNDPRELVTPPRDTNTEPEWVRKSNEMQRGAREVVSPPKYQQTAQPAWSTRPSENRKSLPKDNAPQSPGSRVIPIQMEVSSTETRDAGRQGHPQPQLRITIGMNPNPNDQARAPFSPPTQRIMRVLSPQLVRLDDGQIQHDLPTLNRTFQNQDQPKTRIIPIQIEGNGGAHKSFGGRY
ncbi:extensin-2 isoform X2 [Manduca sexta]|uniref:extensin-2 isoform X2 n=1 Tax=Manduca sexta TaxID=7130 RepID=UPI00188E6F94|nr:extensin-2 isoform X2 [Manduca sexta]